MILHIARREWAEQLRQPAMLASIAALFTVIAGVATAAVVVLDLVARDPGTLAEMARWQVIGGGGVGPVVAGVVSVANWLIFTQYLGISAVLAGHAVLHDRERGTLPFLLVAPVGRGALIGGKVLGSLGAPTALFWLTNGVAAGLMALLPVHVHARDVLPTAAAWWVAFLVGAPAWSAFVCTVCALISSAVHDVRTAQQLVWLVMFFATFVCGALLAGLMAQGVGVQVAVALLGLACTALVAWAGAVGLRRDLER